MNTRISCRTYEEGETIKTYIIEIYPQNGTYPSGSQYIMPPAKMKDGNRHQDITVIPLTFIELGDLVSHFGFESKGYYETILHEPGVVSLSVGEDSYAIITLDRKGFVLNAAQKVDVDIYNKEKGDNENA